MFTSVSLSGATNDNKIKWLLLWNVRLVTPGIRAHWNESCDCSTRGIGIGWSFHQTHNKNASSRLFLRQVCLYLWRWGGKHTQTHTNTHTHGTFRGQRRTPWCIWSHSWWADPRGSGSDARGAWRSSPSWETPPYSRNAGTCSLHPVTHTHKHTHSDESLRMMRFFLNLQLVSFCLYLVVDGFAVQGNVDGEGGRVVMRSQSRLLVRSVTDHKVHNGLGLHTKTHTQNANDL